MELVEKDHVSDGMHETRITVSSCCCRIFQQNQKRSSGDGTTAIDENDGAAGNMRAAAMLK